MRGAFELEWTGYWSQAVPKTATPEQLKEWKRAFYAGAYALAALLHETARAQDTEGARRIHQELNAFKEKVLAGEA